MAQTRTLLQRYKLRLRRKRMLLRALRKWREMSCISRKTGSIRANDILLFATVRNERLRLPYFLDHYRRLGVRHFLLVDNGSEDGTGRYLADQPDISVWHTKDSYKAARFGMDWLTALLWWYGHGHWVVTVDADELLIYPDWETRPLESLTGWLDQQGTVSMGALMLDLYPKGSVADTTYAPGQNPMEVIPWFDAYGYWAQRQSKLDNLWLQGGPRARHFFADDPARAPTLNKIPLVRWNRSYVFVNSTHNALPVSLNQTYDSDGAHKTTGVLLHTKFLPDVSDRAAQEQDRAEHFGDPAAYAGYYQSLSKAPDLWTDDSHRYENWQQLERLGLMFRGAWPPH